MAGADHRAHRRSDALRSRTNLVDAVGRLLLAGRVDFSVPELAAEAGVGVATAYRHFGSPSEALQAYSDRAVAQLRDALTAIDGDLTPAARFIAYCTHWVAQAREWGPAVRHIRSHEGYIERLRRNEPAIRGLHTTLCDVLDDLVTQGAMPPTDLVFAALLWITIFDERVIYDLAEHHAWSTDRITDALAQAVAGSLHIQLATESHPAPTSFKIGVSGPTRRPRVRPDGHCE